MYYCTERAVITKGNRHQFNNAPVGTVFFRLASNGGTRVIERLALKRLMETHEISVRNLKLDSAGKIIQNNQLDKIREHMKNKIINGTLTIYSGSEEAYVSNTVEIIRFLEKNPDCDPADLVEMVNDLANEIEASGKKVYTCGYANVDGDMNNFSYSYNKNHIINRLATNRCELGDSLQWYLPEEEEEQDEYERVIMKSIKKFTKVQAVKNIKTFAYDTMEFRADVNKSKHEVHLCMNINTKNMLAALVCKMTLKEKLQIIHERVATLETIKDIKEIQHEEIKKLFANVVSRSREKKLYNVSYRCALNIESEEAVEDKNAFYISEEGDGCSWYYAVLKIIDRLGTKNVKALTELDDGCIGVTINDMGIKVKMTYNTINNYGSRILIVSPWDPDDLDILFE